MTLQIVSAKFYAQTFQISKKTAQIWYNDDLQSLGRKRLTLDQFKALYTGLESIRATNVKPSAEMPPTSPKWGNKA